ncbi:unnamed protein product [Polarella glacialis]|uniref:Elongation of fatty acids protein n=1 Tax=Polarella glacialis TaxID=89957 RepID=A0A813JIP8_POLGL|nr:unnamed protein product [Polarella glacialis]
MAGTLLLTTWLCSWGSGLATLVLPADNDLTRFRAGPIETPWTQPKVLSFSFSGEDVEIVPLKVPARTSGGAPTDVALPSTPGALSVPTLDFMFHFQFEKEFIGATLTKWCREHWYLSIVVSGLYLVLLSAGTAWMKDKEAFNLKAPLAVWNLFLAVFSFCGMVRTVPHLIAMGSEYGFMYTVCRAATISYGNGPAGLWVCLFIFSKYVELIDTWFLVVRKRNVGFLHWYHHCTVLLYCWHAYVWEMPTGIYFVAMNYSVHAIMYLYYFLAAVMKRPPKWALLVTIVQLVQMAIGITITVIHIATMMNRTVPNCDGHLPNLAAALCMYASYFMLFAQFLFLRYCIQKRDKLADKLN